MRRHASVGVIAAVVGLVLLTRSAYAEEPAVSAAPAPAPSKAPSNDIVRLKDGSVVRGTISELLEGRSVTVVTLSGKTLEFAMDAVRYAGPESRDPDQLPPSSTPATNVMPTRPDEPLSGTSEPRPYVTVIGKMAKLHLTATTPGVTFYRQSMAAGALRGYERLCTAPCEVSLPAGTETFGISLSDGHPRHTEPLTFPVGSSNVIATYESRSTLRTVGWVVFIGGSVLGFTTWLASQSSQSCNDSGDCHEVDEHQGLRILGAAIGIGSLSGIFMIFAGDNAEVKLAGPSRAAVLPDSRPRRAPAFSFSGVF